MLRVSALPLVPLVMLVNAWVFAGDEVAVRKLSDRFQRARNTGDMAAARELLGESSTIYTNGGRGLRPLLSDLRAGVRARAAAGKNHLEPVRVVSRQVDIRGQVAIVTELVGANAGIVPPQKIAPRRRTLVWTRVENEWKVTHVHISPYATWERAIRKFEASDQETTPEPQGVVFIGSSSIVGWESLAEDFSGTVTIRRGFGGSEVIDSVLYAHRVVTPYRPRRVAVYAGDNDIARGKTPQRVFTDFRLFVRSVHATLPKTRIGFMAIKPSLSRWEMWPRMKDANQRIRAYAETEPLIDYLDIATPMLGADGKPMTTLFLQDGLHLNPQGYAVWKKVMAPWVQAKP